MMTEKQTDLFGDHPRFVVEGNPRLSLLCNQLLDMIDRYPELLDGKTVGEIDRRMWLEMCKENGMGRFIANWDEFMIWAMDTNKLPDEEDASRARRFLLERDAIRLSASVVRDAERQRVRIERSVKP